MSLTDLFQRHASPSRWEAFARSCGPRLEESLARLVQKGREQFPGIAIGPECFVAFLARHLPADLLDDSGADTLRTGDLYLACAYGLGDVFAREHLESEHICDVRQSLRYSDTPESSIAEILQELRGMLLEMHDPSSERRHYTGRGDLLTWLRVTALQKAGQVQRRTKDATAG